MILDPTDDAVIDAIANAVEARDAATATALLTTKTDPLAAALFACAAFERLRGRGGIHLANRLRLYLEDAT